jgi:hypothetical protein
MMSVRFTEFFKHQNKDFSLYVMQGTYDANILLVQIKSGEHLHISMWGKTQNAWLMPTEDVPEWVSELKHILELTVDIRMRNFLIEHDLPL